MQVSHHLVDYTVPQLQAQLDEIKLLHKGTAKNWSIFMKWSDRFFGILSHIFDNYQAKMSERRQLLILNKCTESRYKLRKEVRKYMLGRPEQILESQRRLNSESEFSFVTDEEEELKRK